MMPVVALGGSGKNVVLSSFTISVSVFLLTFGRV